MDGRAEIVPFPRRPRGPRPAAPPGTPALAEVYRGTEAEALVVRALLESVGIPTVLRTRLTPSVHPFSVGEQGTVGILVPAAEAARTRRLLARSAGDRRPS